MPIEAALVKPVVDALMALFRHGENLHLKHNAEAALREVIRELLLANPDENRAEARIAIAKAAGILSEDVVLAEGMLRKHRENRTKTAGKGASSRPRRARKSADEPPGESKAGAKPVESKSKSSKATESRPADSKASESKATDSKTTDSKAAQPKAKAKPDTPAKPAKTAASTKKPKS